MIRARKGAFRVHPRVLTSAQLAAALLLTMLFTFPFALEEVGPDRASAGSRQRVELVKLRTRTSKTYRNGNGSLTTTLFSGSVNFRQPGRGWQSISSRLVPARRTGYAWRNEANSFQTFFRKQITDGDYLRFAAAGVNFGFRLEGVEGDSSATANDGRVSYRDAVEGVDLRYALVADGLKETLVLPDAEAPTSYRFLMTPPAGVRTHAERQEDGSWAILLGSRARPLFVLEAPTAEDADGVRGGSPTLDIVREGRRFALELSLDERWLQSPKRSFPVLLDPTITIQSSSQDASFNDACPTCTPLLDTKLYIGTTATERWRSAVQFNLGDVPLGANVTDARLKLYYAGSCVPPADGICKPLSARLNAHRITSQWSTTSTSGALAFDPTPVASLDFATIADADVQWLNWDVTATTKNWLAGTQTNNGLLLKRETEPPSASGPAALSRRYTTEASLQPKLEVTYSGDGVDLLPPDTLHANGAELRWTRYTGPSGAPFVKYEVHRSAAAKFTPTSSTLLATIGDRDVTSFRDTTAAPSKAFSYRVVANSSVSNERRVTLPGPGNSNKTLQPLPREGRATYVDNAGAHCANHGAESDVWLSADLTAVRRGLLHFDLRDIPATATITGARLSVWRPFHAGVNAWVDAHRVTSAWEEGTGSDACTGDGATWAETEAGVGWSSPGVDYDPTPARSINSNNGGTWNNFYIDPLVQQWVSGQAPNLGVLLKLQDESQVDKKKFRYYGDDFSVAPTLRPKLFVAYTDGSQAQGPAVALSAPAGGEQVGGSAVKIAAAAADDRRVDKVEFFVDGGTTPIASDTTAPFEVTWNSTGIANGTHTLSAKATDDAGNFTLSSPGNVIVHNSAVPTTNVTSPGPGATVAGTAPVSASAGDDIGVTKVEFYSDDVLIATDTTAPYSVSWNTLDQGQPAYDGSHALTSKVYDTGGQSTTSPATNITTANTSGTKFKASFASTEFPQSVIYDPASATQDKYGLDVTVTNTSATTWVAGDVVLKYRWYSPDATPEVTDGADVPLGTDLAAGQSRVLRVMADPPKLPDGVNKAEYQLRLDLYSKSSGAWFADKGNKPLENPVIVNKALVRGALGFEPYYQFDREELGLGMRHEVNVANGNSMVSWTPFSAPGRGVDTVLTLTYNALEKKCECPAGNNVSLGISSLTRFGNPIDVHPNKADEIGGRSNKYIEFADADGTTHRFTSNDGITYQEPAGVHLFLRRYSTTDPARKWALTTPDRVTYFYDSEGFPTFVQDRNGNKLTFTLVDTPPAEDPGGPKRRVTKVTDAGGRAFTITYWAKADKVASHVRGKIRRITDHSGSPLDFEYYDDGNLRKLIQRGGTNADGSFLADRSFVFTYTTSDGSGPAIPLPADRVDPDAKTPNQSTRMYSVRDPRGHETRFSYLGPGNGEDRWKLASRTDRANAVTTYGYDIANRVTTVTLPLSRVWKYGYDVEGKVTAITNPLDQQTTQAWNGDRMLTKVTEPTGKFVESAYNANGLVTDQWDQLRNHTVFEYDNLAVDGNDVAANWKAGRTIPHLSQVVRQTAPEGVATTTPTDDYQQQLSYDLRGNVTTVVEPDSSKPVSARPTTRFTWNPEGTPATRTDANGNTTSFNAYDANGFPTRIVHPDGKATQVAYDDDGQLLWTQDRAHEAYSGGDPTSYRTYNRYDSFGRLGLQTTPKSTATELGRLILSGVEFDSNDNVVKTARPRYDNEAPVFVTNAFDEMDRPTLETRPVKSADPAGERTSNTYDAAGRLVATTAPKGVASAIANDFTTFNDYDKLDRVTATFDHIVDAGGTVTKTRRVHLCYDLADDLRSETSALGDATFASCPAATEPYEPLSGPGTTTYVYDATHRLLKDTTAGNTYSRTYDRNGLVATQTDPANKTTTRTYDERGQLIALIEPFDGTRTVTRKFVYDGVGNVTQEISPRAFDAAGGTGSYSSYVTKHVYDVLGQEIRLDLPTSAAYPTQYYRHFRYDAGGNLTSLSVPTATVDPAAVADANKTVATYYDTGSIRTLKNEHAPATLLFDYTAAGLQTCRAKLTNGADCTGNLDGQMRWSYDNAGRIIQTVDVGGRTETFSYDANGNQIASTASTGVTQESQTALETQEEWDGFDQLVKVRGRTVGGANYTGSKYEYNLDGDVIARVDNLVETPAGDTVQPGRRQQFTIGDDGSVTTVVDDGPTSAAGDDIRISDVYTSTGRRASRLIESNDGTAWRARQRSTMTYYDNGLIKTVTGEAMQAGAWKTVSNHALSYVAGGLYANGHVVSDAFTRTAPGASGVPCQSTACTTTFDYDPQERLVKWGDGRAATWDFRLDPTGNVLSETKNGGASPVRSFTYNGGRLATQSNAAGVQKRYFYDADGNLACVTSGAGSDADCPVQAGSSATSDSPSPNLRAAYAYDDRNRLDAFHRYAGDGSGDVTDSASYVYDTFDRTVAETEAHGVGATATTTTFTPRGLDRDIAREAGGAVTKDFAYDARGSLVGLSAAGGSTTPYTYGYDARGSVDQLIDPAGGVAASYGYNPYGSSDGELTNDTTNGVNPYRFNARRYDTGSDTLDLLTRRLDVDSARYLQQDAFEDAPDDLAISLDLYDQNRYAFVGGNPVTFVDADGHAASDINGYKPVRFTGPPITHKYDFVAGHPRGWSSSGTVKLYPSVCGLNPPGYRCPPYAIFYGQAILELSGRGIHMQTDFRQVHPPWAHVDYVESKWLCRGMCSSPHYALTGIRAKDNNHWKRLSRSGRYLIQNRRTKSGRYPLAFPDRNKAQHSSFEFVWRWQAARERWTTESIPMESPSITCLSKDQQHMPQYEDRPRCYFGRL
jgi:RHS repeat-associated protein